MASSFDHCLGKPPALPQDSRSSIISGMFRVAVSNGNPIPLTLTLSRREREQAAAGSVVRDVRRADTALRCAERQRRILPAHEPGGTSNIEHRMAARILARFGVRCSMLDVRCFPSVLYTAPYGLWTVIFRADVGLESPSQQSRKRRATLSKSKAFKRELQRYPDSPQRF